MRATKIPNLALVARMLPALTLSGPRIDDGAAKDDAPVPICVAVDLRS